MSQLDRVRRWTGRMDWTTRPIASAHLDETNAFLAADDAEERGLQLLDPITYKQVIISRQ